MFVNFDCFPATVAFLLLLFTLLCAALLNRLLLLGQGLSFPVIVVMLPVEIAEDVVDEEVVDVVDSSQSGSDELLYIGTSLDDARYSTGHLTFETFSGFVDGLLFSLRDFISAGEGESVLAEDTN